MRRNERTYWAKTLQATSGAGAAGCFTLAQFDTIKSPHGWFACIDGIPETWLIGGGIVFVTVFVLCGAGLWFWALPFRSKSPAVETKLKDLCEGKFAVKGLVDIANDAYRVTILGIFMRRGRRVLRPVERIGKHSSGRSKVYFHSGEACAGEAWAKAQPAAKWGKNRSDSHLPYDDRKAWAEITGVPERQRKLLGPQLAWHLICVPILRCDEGEFGSKHADVVGVLSLDIYCAVPNGKQGKLVQYLQTIARQISDMVVVAEEARNV